jgi:hypothetical protein
MALLLSAAQLVSFLPILEIHPAPPLQLGLGSWPVGLTRASSLPFLQMLHQSYKGSCRFPAPTRSLYSLP